MFPLLTCWFTAAGCARDWSYVGGGPWAAAAAAYKCAWDGNTLYGAAPGTVRNETIELYLEEF